MSSCMKPTEAEIACFEAGVKLGSLYHQFSGAPVSIDSIESLSSAIEKSIENQPYCTEVSVEIFKDKVQNSMNEKNFLVLLINDIQVLNIHELVQVRVAKDA